jgi:hypothetical protein
VWLTQQNVKQNSELVLKKLNARNKQTADFLTNIEKHSALIQTDQSTRQDFFQEMSRFLPQNVMEKTLQQTPFWPYVGQTIAEQVNDLKIKITQPKPPQAFDMST